MTEQSQKPQTFFIDGHEIDIREGETIFRAARRLDIKLPHLCYLPQPGYRADGNCRVCMVEVEGERVPQQAVWMRMRAPMPDDPRLHRAALAYLSDMTIQESILRRHGLTWSTPGLKVASLDHAMWWHRFGRVDEWMLYVQEAPNARGGRGLAQGRIYSRDGELLATVAQEIMVRVPDGAR